MTIQVDSSRVFLLLFKEVEAILIQNETKHQRLITYSNVERSTTIARMVAVEVKDAAGIRDQIMGMYSPSIFRGSLIF